MSSAPTADEIARDARWLVQAIDPGAGLARLVSMTPADYRDESFLDDRLMGHSSDSVLTPWALVADAAARIDRNDARWIFHIGHVGSTLVSRMLGELPSVLAVREPRALRDLLLYPGPEKAAPLAAAPRLFARTFGDDQAAVVKATSFVSELAPELVSYGGRVLFLTASPRRYVASILAGDNSRKELAGMANFRRQRMMGRVDGIDHAANDADAAAIAWACEATALEAAAEAMPGGAILWADFDAMLDNLASGLETIAAHFDVAAEPDTLTAIADGPLAKRYSKALDHAYSATLRAELIAEADAAHRADIDSALAMLDRAAKVSPLLQRALNRAGELECSALSTS